jgi:hypothetical protein
VAPDPELLAAEAALERAEREARAAEARIDGVWSRALAWSRQTPPAGDGHDGEAADDR